jgi:hypothetical protein
MRPRIVMRPYVEEDQVLEDFTANIEVRINGELVKQNGANLSSTTDQPSQIVESNIKTDENGQVDPNDFFNYKL